MTPARSVGGRCPCGRLVCLLILILLSSPVFAQVWPQKSEIDQLKLKSGKHVPCRVLHRRLGEAIYILRSGKIEELPWDDVAASETVTDRLREFFALLDETENDIRRSWAVAEWARKKKLSGMARVQAYRVLIRAPDHAEAHAFLGHRRIKKQWRWRRGNDFVSANEFLNPARGWNDAPQLRTAHFRLRSTGDFAAALDSIVDLERVRLAFIDEFGAALEISEATRLLSFELREIKRSTTPRPYVELTRSLWLARASLDDKGRGLHLPELLTQMMLNSLFSPARGEKKAPSRISAPKTAPTRAALWLELGLGWWFENRFRGPQGGRKLPEEPKLDRVDRRELLKWMKEVRADGGFPSGGWRDLGVLTRWSSRHYYAEGLEVELRWIAARAFVAFLMDERTTLATTTKKQDANAPQARDALLRYAKQIFLRRKSPSSRLLAEAFGLKIESLEGAFRSWLAKN